MAVTVNVRLGDNGADAGPFDLYTDADNYTLAYATGISDTVLTGPLGYTSVVPPGSTIENTEHRSVY